MISYVKCAVQMGSDDLCSISSCVFISGKHSQIVPTFTTSNATYKWDAPSNTVYVDKYCSTFLSVRC